MIDAESSSSYFMLRGAVNRESYFSGPGLAIFKSILLKSLLSWSIRFAVVDERGSIIISGYFLDLVL